MSALRNVKRSIALASGLVRNAGRHGRSVGPYVCATVELRLDDLREVVAAAEKSAEPSLVSDLWANDKAELRLLKMRIKAAVIHLDRAIDAEQRPAAVLQGDAQLARHALTGASSRAALSPKRAAYVPPKGHESWCASTVPNNEVTCDCGKGLSPKRAATKRAKARRA